MSQFEVVNDQTGPQIIQLSVFLPNRIGALLGIIRQLEDRNIHLCAISILDAADHAVIRMVVDRPDLARDSLIRSGHEVFETELIGVEIPTRKDMGPKNILSALLMAEVNVHYIYSLIVRTNNHPVLALNVDDVPTARKVLTNHGLQLIGQDEISWDDEEA